MERGHLVLSRKLGEGVAIGGQVIVRVQRVKNGSVRLSVSAPKNVLVLREELSEREAA